MATIDAIKKLHISMIDTRRAYEKAQSEAENPQLKAFFGSMIEMRQEDHEQLHRVLTQMGEKPDEDGSFMTNVHEAVIAVRSAVVGLDQGSLGAFASGEQSIVKQYDDALAQDDIRAETTGLLQRQKAALLEKIDAMEAMFGST